MTSNSLVQVSFLSEGLTVHEQQELQANEQIIERGLTTFYQVGTALLAIRDQVLYRQDYGTFEEYCLERWGFRSRHAQLLMRAHDVMDNLEMRSIDRILPTHETQVRPLTNLPPEQQVEVWERAVETAPNGRITAAHVKQVVAEMTGPPPSAMAVHYSSETTEWYTPRHVIDLVVAFFDVIDLDPCSNSHETPNVPAAYGFTQEDDGLQREWFGRVYMNPPYGDEITAWVKKLHDAYHSGEIEAGIALVPARVDTAWWHDYVMPYAMCLIRGRLKFVGAENSAPFPSALVYYGDEILRFQAVTAAIGPVVTVYSGQAGDRVLYDTFDDGEAA